MYAKNDSSRSFFFVQNLSKVTIQRARGNHNHSKTFLIRTAAGVPFVPVFSSGQFVSIRGTTNPSCIHPLNHPWTIREPDTVCVHAHYSTRCIKNQSTRIAPLSLYFQFLTLHMKLNSIRISILFSTIINCFHLNFNRFCKKANYSGFGKIDK